MDHLRKRYNKEELEELKRILNSSDGEEYISRVFDEFKLKESDQLTSKYKSRLLESIHKGISIEELIQSLEEEHKVQRKPADKSRGAIRFGRSGKQFSRIFMYAASILLILLFIWNIDLFFGNHNDHISNNESYIQKSTAKGQKLVIRLMDGSKVTLNSNSTIKYPAAFNDSLREVHIEGEAFFEVARDEQNPFVVHAGNLISRVLGTSFNIKYFPEDQISKVALVTGKVKVSHLDSNNSNEEDIVLLPGEMAELHAGKINKGIFDVGEETGWKNNIIIFKNADYREIFETLENWYGVEIECIGYSSVESWKLNAKFEDVSLEKILKALSESHGISYEINGNNVTIKLKPME